MIHFTDCKDADIRETVHALNNHYWEYANLSRKEIFEKLKVVYKTDNLTFVRWVEYIANRVGYPTKFRKIENKETH